MENKQSRANYRRSLPQRVHICRWCPTCTGEMTFNVTEIRASDNVIRGIKTVCSTCGYEWPLTLTVSASNEQFPLESE